MVFALIWVLMRRLGAFFGLVRGSSWRRRTVPRGRKASTHMTPPAHPRAKPDWVLHKVLYLATHLTTCRSIATAFNRWHGGHVTVGKSWVAVIVKQHAAHIANRRRQMRRRKPVCVPVGNTWALDLSYLASPGGAQFTMLGIIDHGSRKLLCLKVLRRKCAFTVLGHLFLAFARFGPPKAVRTDNEAMFTSKLWQGSLQALSITPRRGPPMQPWRNGRIERLFGTLKPLLKKLQPTTTPALQATLNEFKAFYNHIRPHQNLGDLTPDEAWHGQTMADVQRTHAQTEGEWVQALGGLLVGYRVRR